MSRAVPAASARLQRPASASGAPPAAPAPIAEWRDDGDAIGVEVAVSSTGMEAVADVARQLPDPSSIAAGTVVFVLAEPASRGTLARLLGRIRRDAIPSSIRGSALAVRGYVDIGGNEDAAWGIVPPK